MKCPHCNLEHPDDYQFCPKTGKKIELLKACMNNPSCPDHGKYIWPSDSRFCPKCGATLDDSAGIKKDSGDNKDFELINETESMTIIDEPKGNKTKEALIIAKQKGDYYDGFNKIVIYNAECKQIYERISKDWSRSLEVKWEAPGFGTTKKLYIGEKGGKRKTDVIGLDGMVVKVDDEQLPWNQWYAFDEEEFLLDHHEYSECVRPDHHIENGDFIVLGYKDTPNGSYIVDVLNASGNVLCTLPLNTTVDEVLPSGLLVVTQPIDDECRAFGIADRRGNILVPCKYGIYPRHEDGDNPFKEDDPGVIYCDEFDEENLGYGNVYYNTADGEYYDQITKDFCVKAEDGDSNTALIVFDRENKSEIYRFHTVLGNGLITLDNGWNELTVENDDGEDVTYLLSKQGCVKLADEESVYNCYSAKGFDEDAYDTTDGELYNNYPFISEDRIITYVGNTEDGLDGLKKVRIYDSSGNIVKHYVFKQLPLLIKAPYKYGKALCFKLRGGSITLWYLDLDGNEHEIPYNGGCKVKSYSETDMFMVSEDTFAINFKTEDFKEIGELRNLDGEVLFKTKSCLKPFGNNLVAYCDDNKGYVIIDAKGNEAIPPHFDEYEWVECSNGKYLCHDQDGYCKEL
jgi:hypothetical protein